MISVNYSKVGIRGWGGGGVCGLTIFLNDIRGRNLICFFMLLIKGILLNQYL